MHIGGGPFSLVFYYLYMIDKVKYHIEALNTGGIAIDKIEGGRAGKRSSLFSWLKNRSRSITNKIWLLSELNSPFNSRDVDAWEMQWCGGIKDRKNKKMFINSSHEQSKGVGIFIHPSLDLEISTEHPSVMPQFGVLAGRVISVTVKIGGEWMSLVSIYAPTGSANRARGKFFKELIKSTSHLPNRVYGGDWNYVDNDVLDKSHQHTTYGTKGGEAWKSHVNSSQMGDPYRVIHPDGKAYSHTSPTLQNRIDRFYIDSTFMGWVADVTHHHCYLSHDHKLVSLQLITDETLARGKDRWFFNNSHLLSPSFINMLRACINNYVDTNSNKDEIGPAVWLDQLLAYLKDIIISYSKEKKGYVDRSLKSLEALHGNLATSRDKMDPPSPLILSQIKEIRLQIEDHILAHTYGAKIRSRSRFSSAFEQPSSTFFQMAKTRGKGSVIQAVRDDGPAQSLLPVHQRPVREDQEGKQTIFKSYYERLFSTKIIDDSAMHDTAALLNKLDPEQSKLCEGEMSMNELHASLCTFHNNKSPGPDGFGKEFWRVFWVDLSPHLLDACNHSFSTVSLSPLMSSGYISLLFKKDDKQDVKKYRPLTLLPFHYKILTKALTIRLSKVINHLCDPSQTGFIRGRYIMENIRLVMDTIEYCESETIPAYWVMLDFEKAYDRVSWVYLHACLKMANLGMDFRRWITVLYPLDPTTHPEHYLELGMDITYAITHHRNIIRQLIMNGHATDPFSLHCGVAQGCPLSCLLFVLCVEPLHIRIRQSQITGIQLPPPTGYDPLGVNAQRDQCKEDIILAKQGKLENTKSIKGIDLIIKTTRQNHELLPLDKKQRLVMLRYDREYEIKEGKRFDTQIKSFMSKLDEIPDKIGRTVKSAGYADDTAVILATWDHFNYLLSIISVYESASGALNNKDKMLVIPVGGAQATDLVGVDPDQVLQPGCMERYLGAQAGVSCKDKLIRYWDTTMTNKIVSRLRAWQSLFLSLVGRVLVLKTMALSLIWFHASCMHIPNTNKTLKRITHCTSSYVWKSSRDDCGDPARRVAGFANINTACLPWRLGGVSMCNTIAQIGAIRAKWIRMLHDPSTSLWKDLAWHAIHLAGSKWGLGKLILCRPPSNALYKHIKHSIGSSFPFWADVIIDWLKLKPIPIDKIDYKLFTYERIISQPLWFNPHITLGSKMLAWGDWCPGGNNRQSYHVIGDIWDHDALEFVTIESISCWLTASKSSPGKLTALITAIPPAWIDTLKEGIQPYRREEWVMDRDDGLHGIVEREEVGGLVGVQWMDPAQPFSLLFFQPACISSNLYRAQVTTGGELLGPTSMSTFDPSRIGWDMGDGNLIPVSGYTVKIGHTLATTVHPAASTKMIQRKWQVSFNWHRFDWEQVWARLVTIKIGKHRAFQWKVLHAIGRFQFISRTACCMHCDPHAVDPHVTAYHAMFICPIAMGVWRWVGALWKHMHDLTISISTPYLITGLQPLSSVPIILRTAWDLIHLTTLHTIWCAWCRWIHDEISYTIDTITSSINSFLTMHVPALANQAVLKTICMKPLLTEGVTKSPPTPIDRVQMQWSSTLSLCPLSQTHVYSYTGTQLFTPAWHKKELYRHQRPQAWLHIMAATQNPDVFQPKYRLTPYIPPVPD